MQQQFELCAETLQACVAAQEGGAHRIELCAALNEGGVTPSLGFLRETLAAVSLPVHVLMRPRSGDFFYTEAEFRMLCADMDAALRMGAAGVVVGVLCSNLEVDTVRLAHLLRLAQGRPVTFHRAFDMVRDQTAALEQLIDLGVHRVLTSGGSPTVMDGRQALTALAGLARGRIRVAAGGGITVANAAAFAAVAGLDLHASLRRKSAAVAEDPLWADATGHVAREDVQAIAALLH